MIGSCVSHYRILEKLGAGGMGEVYAAEDTHLARRVAIKFPYLKEDGTGYRDRFLIEARAASRLDHPNIGRIYDYGEAPDGRPFLVMELVTGTTLREALKDGPLPPASAVAIMEGVLRALREAHGNHLVHRDVKPSNVMLTGSGEVKVLDFGLAKEILEAPTGILSQAETAPMGLTRAGQIPGSPEYMSPEQARGQRLDGRSDLFSAGLVLYECLTGRKAFSGANAPEVLAQVVRVDPPPPSASVPGVPAALDRITSKALAKDPAERYQTADEMLSDLAASASQSRSVSRIARNVVAGLAASRHRVALVGVLGLAVASLAGSLVWRARPHEPSPEAMRWYQLGAAALRDGTYYRAAKALEQAAAIDPDFALAHARLAEAWNELDDTGKAKGEMLLARGPTDHTPTGSGALYADAILHTLTGDFAGAIRNYTTLIARVPDPDKSAVLVDLGRARERNGETAKALEAYREAARRDPQNAAAHLRAGILLGRQQNPAAGAEFARAEALYQSLSNTEGQAEVLIQRGSWASTDLRRLPEARAALEKAIQLSRAISTEYQEIASTLQLSVVTFQEGDPTKAEGIASAALDKARRAGMAYLAARGLTDLASTRMLKGDFGRAEADLREALELSRRFQMRRNEARSLFALAGLYDQQRRAEAVLGEIGPALAFYRQAGFRQEELLCLTLIARANRNLGKEGEALAAFQEQLSLAKSVDDQNQMGLAEQGIASVLLQQEHLADALVHYERYCEIGRSVKSRDRTVRALAGRADVLWRLGRYQEAEGLLSEAEGLIGSAGSATPLAAVILERRAEMALSRRLFAEAASKARHAIGISSATPSNRASAQCLVGLALSRDGSAHAGKSLCEECVAGFGAQTERQSLAEARLALAEVLLATGETKQAEGLIRQGLEVIDAAGRKESGWRGWVLAARAYRRAGDDARAKEAIEQASTRLAALRGMWLATDFDRYAQRPDVSGLLRELKR